MTLQDMAYEAQRLAIMSLRGYSVALAQHQKGFKNRFIRRLMGNSAAIMRNCVAFQ
jgi:hypothetical protein